MVNALGGFFVSVRVEVGNLKNSHGSVEYPH